jgi:hypothetical protein
LLLSRRRKDTWALNWSYLRTDKREMCPCGRPDHSGSSRGR